jgi:pimeloyl-ACP methyl ester carboxylesterase
MSEADAHFDAQWNVPAFSPWGRTSPRIYDIAPAHGLSPVPVIIAMGWLNGPYTFKGLMRELVRRGRRVILIDARHGIDTPRIDAVAHIHARKMAPIVAFILDRRKAHDFERADILGLSEGGIVAVLLKYRHHDLVRHLVLVNPAGLIGKDNLLALALRYPSDVVPAFLAQAWKRGLRRAQEGARPIESTLTLLAAPHRALQSVLAIAASDSRAMLETIGERGGCVAIIACRDDRAFPVRRIERAVGERPGLMLEIHPGTHNTPSNEPEAFGEIIGACLAELERRC